MRKYLIYLVLFAILEISLALYLTFWREHFWTAVSSKESLQFMYQLGIFTIVALFICLVSGISGYLVSLTAIKWREKLNKKALIVNTFKCHEKVRDNVENLNQRIQADCLDYPTLMLTLGFGGTKALVYVFAFSVALLWGFNALYISFLIAYAICGTLIVKYVAKPLISLNYKQQQVEATYRNNLSIQNFSDCVLIMLGLAKKTKRLTYFQQFYSQVGVVIPLIIVAHEYFTTAMTLGLLMRFNSTSGTILDNMSYGISSFGDINKLLSCRKRLLEAGIL